MLHFSTGVYTSSGYLLNDVKDPEFDRLDPVKKRRPIASRQLSFSGAVLMAFLLLVLGVLISTLVSLRLASVLLLYVFCCTLYTFLVKRIVLFDVFLLVSLYCLRIFAGGIAADVTVSF